jgi:hypothetical protein
MRPVSRCVSSAIGGATRWSTVRAPPSATTRWSTVMGMVEPPLDAGSGRMGADAVGVERDPSVSRSSCSSSMRYISTR